MANVLTDLAADIYTAADTVGRELTGATSSVLINANGADRAAVGDTVRSHVTNQATAVNVSPSMTIPEGTDQTVGNKTMSITKSRAVQIPWTGEDMKHVNNGSGFETIYGDQVRQAMEDPQRDDQQVAVVLEDLSETYREVVALCQAVQGKLAEELQDLQRGRQGAKVYQMFR